MTRNLRALFFIQALVITAAAQALTVNLIPYHEYCGVANGYILANVGGGVPPYTYEWSNGGTSQAIYNLVAGTYSVTVTDFVGTQETAQVTLNNYPSYPNTLMGGSRAYCDPYGYTILYTTGLTELNLDLPMAGPFTVQGIPTETIFNGGWGDIVIAQSGAPGSTYPITYFDANGCLGTATMQLGYPVQFPVLSLLSVEGSCSSGSNGSLQVALTAEGGEQMIELELKDASGDVLGVRATGAYAQVHSFGNLAAGNYWLVQRIPNLGSGSMGTLMRNYCGDSLQVTVPDLGPACGNVNGTVYMDYDEDCVMGSAVVETRVPGALLEFTPGPFYATASGTGTFSINLPSGAYTLQQIATDIAQYCPAPPAPLIVSGNQALNIADTALVPMDVQVSVASGPARPGFVLQYAIEQNNLTPATTGTTSTVMTYDPTVTFISSNPAPSLVSGNTLTWDQASLGAFGDRSIHVQFQVPPDVGLIGTVLNASVALTTANVDAVMANNNASTSVTITASYDPNDKTALTSSQWSNDLYYIDVDNWIDYTIRFQNTGTDTAFTVIITDTLPTTVDPATIQWGAASHTCMRSLTGQGIVKFIFPNILLPDSNVNEAASHGFASFRIRPRLPLSPATVIENIANIYFDFNPPVITEPSVLVAEFSTSLQSPAFDSAQGGQLVLAPNPASDRLVVSAEVGTTETITILAADGREVMRRTLRGSNTSLDVSGLNAGPYFLIATMNNGRVVRERFIKH